MCFFGGGDAPPPPEPVKMPPSNPVPIRADEERRMNVMQSLFAARQGMGRSSTILTGAGGTGSPSYQSAPGPTLGI